MWRCSASHVARASISVSASSAEASVSAASRRALAPPDARARAACARSSAVSRRSLRLCAPAAAARATNAAAEPAISTAVRRSASMACVSAPAACGGGRAVSPLQRRLLPLRRDHEELDDVLIAARRRVVQRLRVPIVHSLVSAAVSKRFFCTRRVPFVPDGLVHQRVLRQSALSHLRAPDAAREGARSRRRPAHTQDGVPSNRHGRPPLGQRRRR
mmetsp:Transcript_21085/g.63129  ORF Transcript_21085/g.63129 Transcript_21085/m.63129 type:complete len:216 (-) Transcript_21085:243-890(-)